jgi:hypothetical protein
MHLMRKLSYGSCDVYFTSVLAIAKAALVFLFHVLYGKLHYGHTVSFSGVAGAW